MPITDARHYKALLICPSKPVLSELTPLLAHGLPLAPMHALNEYPDRRQLVELMRSFEPTLCFLEIGSSMNRAFQVMADLHSLVPALPIIALASSNDPDVILQCLRQGASDFVIRPFTHDQIEACVEKIARLLPTQIPQMAGRAKVIAVFPAKGAAGASTVASNLAFQCKRLGAKRVLLADMDPLTGIISFVLKLKSTYSFMDVLQRQGALDSDLWKQMVSTSHGIDILLPPETPVDPMEELQSAEPIIEFAEKMYDTVILDCGGVCGDWNLSMARFADEVLLVTTSEMGSVQAALRVLRYFEQQRVDTSKVKIVVSRVTKDIGLSLQNLAKVLESEVFQTIPADADAVQKSLMDGKPIPVNTSIGKSFSSLADKLLNLKDLNSGKTSSKGGLFSSIFSR